MRITVGHVLCASFSIRDTVTVTSGGEHVWYPKQFQNSALKIVHGKAYIVTKFFSFGEHISIFSSFQLYIQRGSNN